MKQLDNSIFLLEKSPMAAIKVEFCNTAGNYTTIENNANQKMLIDKYGSVVQFFESLYSKGIRKLRITDRKSNGSSFKTLSEYEVNFSSKDGVISSEPIMNLEPVLPISTPVVPAPTPNIYGMGAPAGLGMVEIHRIQDYDRLVSVNQKLEIENSTLKAKNEALRDENLRNELLGTKSAEKADKQNAMLGTAMPVIMGLLDKFQPVAKVVETAGLAGSENFSPIQNAFLEVIKTADDSILTDLMAIAHGFKNADFDAEITELLKKYNLTT